MAKKGKGELTRDKILDAALTLFRKNGFDKTTMREIAAAADMSLGAAYYYFASKEALVLAYYDVASSGRAERARLQMAGSHDLRERLGALYHSHFDVVRHDRNLLGALVRSVADPESDVSVFSEATAEVRNRTIELFYQALEVDEVPEELRDLGSLGLWTLDLAFMLFFIWDKSPKQHKTRSLIDGTLDILLPALPLMSLPMARPMLGRIAAMLLDAGLVPGES